NRLGSAPLRLAEAAEPADPRARGRRRGAGAGRGAARPRTGAARAAEGEDGVWTALPVADAARAGARPDTRRGRKALEKVSLNLRKQSLTLRRMDAALRAIAEPRRRRILELVGARELTAGEIASHFEVTRPAISQHLGVLKEAGLVAERRKGTQRLYRARPQGLVELKTFLDSFWDEKLEALQQEAERVERSKRDKRN